MDNCCSRWLSAYDLLDACFFRYLFLSLCYACSFLSAGFCSSFGTRLKLIYLFLSDWSDRFELKEGFNELYGNRQLLFEWSVPFYPIWCLLWHMFLCVRLLFFISWSKGPLDSILNQCKIGNNRHSSSLKLTQTILSEWYMCCSTAWPFLLKSCATPLV